MAEDGEQLVNTLTNIETGLHRVERHVNQVTWLLLLIWLSIITMTIVVASVAKG